MKLLKVMMVSMVILLAAGTALADDPQIIFHGQDFCRHGAENCLIIGQNDLVHRCFPSEVLHWFREIGKKIELDPRSLACIFEFSRLVICCSSLPLLSTVSTGDTPDVFIPDKMGTDIESNTSRN